MEIKRSAKNPIVTPEDVKPFLPNSEVIGAFNAGVAEYNGEVLLLLRVAERPISENSNEVIVPIYNHKTGEVDYQTLEKDESKYIFSDPRVIANVSAPNGFKYLTSISYIRIARSKNGEDFTIDDEPFIFPFNESQEYGIEDARCTQIGEDYYINFTSVSRNGVVDSLVKTNDFKSFEYLGNIFSPDNKDVLIFPEKINGKYYALNRPASPNLNKLDIWISESPDLVHWGNHKHLLESSETDWENGRIGAGLVPIKTEQGWLEIYHGATLDNRYCMGALLLDLEDPSKIIAKSVKPFMEPEEDYEKKGFFGDVVFGTGGLVKDGVLTIYYGASDTSMAVCDVRIDDILDSLLQKGH